MTEHEEQLERDNEEKAWFKNTVLLIILIPLGGYCLFTVIVLIILSIFELSK